MAGVYAAIAHMTKTPRRPARSTGAPQARLRERGKRSAPPACGHGRELARRAALVIRSGNQQRLTGQARGVSTCVASILAAASWAPRPEVLLPPSSRAAASPWQRYCTIGGLKP